MDPVGPSAQAAPVAAAVATKSAPPPPQPQPSVAELTAVPPVAEPESAPPPQEATTAAVIDAGTADGLPDGYSMMMGDDGEQYVTVVQDGQTYAIRWAEYQTMLSQQTEEGGSIAIQATPIEITDHGAQSVPTQEVNLFLEEFKNCLPYFSFSIFRRVQFRRRSGRVSRRPRPPLRQAA